MLSMGVHEERNPKLWQELDLDTVGNLGFEVKFLRRVFGQVVNEPCLGREAKPKIED